MSTSTQTQSLLLLTGRFGGAEATRPFARSDRKPDETLAAPLEDVEFDRLAGWLKKRGLNPSDLLQGAGPTILEEWTSPSPSRERLLSLLERETILAGCMERWEQAGLWAIGRADPDYPKRLKRRLRAAAPPVLFGSGDRAVLNRGGLALVGGENTGTEATEFAARFASQAAGVELSMISGCRNGLEEAALSGSLGRGGTAIGVLSGDLLRRAARMRLARPNEVDKQVLVSPTDPEAATTADSSGPAARCVYGLSDAALLVGVAQDGGSWAGAVEAIEHEWVPLWVRGSGADITRLVRLGAHTLPSDEASPRALLTPPRAAVPALPRRRPEFGQPAFDPSVAFGSPQPGPSLVGFAEPPPLFAQDPPEPLPARGAHLRLVPAPEQPRPEPGLFLFEAFTQILLPLLSEGALGLEAIASALDLTVLQADLWLKRAESAGQIRFEPQHEQYELLSGA